MKEVRKRKKKIAKVIKSKPINLDAGSNFPNTEDKQEEQEMGVREEVQERFSVVYNDVDGCVRIFDLWHDSISNLPIDKAINIKDDSPAVRVLTAEHINALVGWMKSKGWLEKYGIGATTSAPTSQPSRKAMQEIAIESIRDITLGTGNGAGVAGVDGSVAKEATSAIREIMNKTLGG